MRTAVRSLPELSFSCLESACSVDPHTSDSLHEDAQTENLQQRQGPHTKAPPAALTPHLVLTSLAHLPLLKHFDQKKTKNKNKECKPVCSCVYSHKARGQKWEGTRPLGSQSSQSVNRIFSERCCSPKATFYTTGGRSELRLWRNLPPSCLSRQLPIAPELQMGPPMCLPHHAGGLAGLLLCRSTACGYSPPRSMCALPCLVQQTLLHDTQYLWLLQSFRPPFHSDPQALKGRPYRCLTQSSAPHSLLFSDQMGVFVLIIACCKR